VAVVVMIAGSCFALGFFVGSASTEREVVTEVIRVPEPPPRLVVEGDDVLPTPPGGPMLTIEGPMGDPDGRDQARQYASAALPDAPAGTYAPPPASYGESQSLSPASRAERSAAASTPPRQTAPAPAARPSAPPRQAAAAPAPAPRAQAPASSASSRARYAVQLGAFSELGDAARLKKTFTAKGYEAYIYRETMASGASIFRVRLGSYTDVEEARRMALKIKSAEGVAAFVAEIK
jgi:cell division septation protein DedD